MDPLARHPHLPRLGGALRFVLRYLFGCDGGFIFVVRKAELIQRRTDITPRATGEARYKTIVAD